MMCSNILLKDEYQSKSCVNILRYSVCLFTAISCLLCGNAMADSCPEPEKLSNTVAALPDKNKKGGNVLGWDLLSSLPKALNFSFAIYNMPPKGKVICYYEDKKTSVNHAITKKLSNPLKLTGSSWGSIDKFYACTRSNLENCSTSYQGKTVDCAPPNSTQTTSSARIMIIGNTVNLMCIYHKKHATSGIVSYTKSKRLTIDSNYSPDKNFWVLSGSSMCTPKGAKNVSDCSFD
jgi:hypothetical protein